MARLPTTRRRLWLCAAAATGGSDVGPGALYAVGAGGQVRRIGAYAGPGGAENIAQAPPGFGSVAGQVLITIDKSDHQGRLLAMDARGHACTPGAGPALGAEPHRPIGRTVLVTAANYLKR